MDRFGISPTVMNETLRILRDRDLVSVRPGPGGGITVASAPPQVRLGALDLSFQPSNPHPLDLFEARLYLEFGLTKAAFERATSDDVAAMRSAMVAMRASTDAEQFFDAVLAFHGVVAAAAHIPVLEGMHQLIVTSIKAVLTRVVFVGDHEPLLKSSLDVHDDIVAAIALHDQASFVDAINRHDQDLIRGRRPGPHAADPAEALTERRRPATHRSLPQRIRPAYMQVLLPPPRCDPQHCACTS